jgi:hypothetical protein
MPADTSAKRDKLRDALLDAAIYHAKASKKAAQDYDNAFLDHATAASTIVNTLAQAYTI